MSNNRTGHPSIDEAASAVTRDGGGTIESSDVNLAVSDVQLHDSGHAASMNVLLVAHTSSNGRLTQTEVEQVTPSVNGQKSPTHAWLGIPAPVGDGVSPVGYLAALRRQLTYWVGEEYITVLIPRRPRGPSEQEGPDEASALSARESKAVIRDMWHELADEDRAELLRELTGSPLPDDWADPEMVEGALDEITAELAENRRVEQPTKYAQMLQIIKATRNQGVTTGDFTPLFKGASDPARRAMIMIGQLNLRHLNPRGFHIRRTTTIPIYHVVEA